MAPCNVTVGTYNDIEIKVNFAKAIRMNGMGRMMDSV